MKALGTSLRKLLRGQLAQLRRADVQIIASLQSQLGVLGQQAGVRTRCKVIVQCSLHPILANPTLPTAGLHHIQGGLRIQAPGLCHGQHFADASQMNGGQQVVGQFGFGRITGRLADDKALRRDGIQQGLVLRQDVAGASQHQTHLTLARANGSARHGRVHHMNPFVKGALCKLPNVNGA